MDVALESVAWRSSCCCPTRNRRNQMAETVNLYPGAISIEQAMSDPSLEGILQSGRLHTATDSEECWVRA